MREDSKAPGAGQNRLAGLLGSALLALWMPAGSAQAQTVGEPAAAPPPRWTLSLGLHEGWDSNVLFSEPEGPGDVLTRIAARLDRTWSGPRGRLMLSGGGEGSAYRRLPDLNRLTYGGDADASYLVSRRVAFRLSDTLRTSYASELAALTTSGLLLPRVLGHANTARGGFSYSASRRTTVSLDIQDDRVSFDSAALVGGSMLMAGATFGRELTRADTVAASFQYQRSAAGGQHGFTQTLYGAWNRGLGASAHLRVRAGASRFQPFASSSFRTTGVGGARLDARRGRQAMEAGYDRAMDLAYGLGRLRINELLAARYALSVTPRLAIELRGAHARGRDPSDPSFELTTTDLEAGLRCALARDLAVVGSYTRRESEQRPSRPLSSQGATVSVSYGRTWR